jgi:hypothetical protein
VKAVLRWFLLLFATAPLWAAEDAVLPGVDFGNSWRQDIRWNGSAMIVRESLGDSRLTSYDRNGHLITTAALQVPDGVRTLAFGFTGNHEGTLAICGLEFGATSNEVPFISWRGANSQSRLILTAPYRPHKIVIAPDGTLWTVGYQGTRESPDPGALVIRQWDPVNAKVIAAYVPQSRFTDPLLSVASGDLLVAAGNRVAWYSPPEGRYFETAGGILTEVDGLDTPGTRFAAGAALTDGGRFFIESGVTYELDRAGKRWVAYKGPFIDQGRRLFDLFGAEGHQLVVRPRPTGECTFLTP